ncbi:GNAT family N-acetyltransferase [Jatrophihabitans telluris]|uniref:GNAT family N-acetyltransferase n=1 Tax=Jatrophihabitans telluris TaxID=2038343 RepID=A0ABY4QZR9_9ACTN|nr:GNAT family N-acetyltransferase [Jatrophihabitans telluris]UQX88828.1 GNAT family N-acetyltransferase [Jatrophihabitans telluris]
MSPSDTGVSPSDTGLSPPDFTLVRRDLDHPDAAALIELVQAEYVRIYGGPDAAPIGPTEFAAPAGHFLVGYLDQVPVAMGGWRRHGDEHPDTAWARSRAEIKRMFVADAARGRGLARSLLTALETEARAQGVHWLLLETGFKQPAAIALYRAAGYRDIPNFGHYADTPLSVHLGKALTSGATFPP